MHRVLIPLWRMGSPAEARLVACGDTVPPKRKRTFPEITSCRWPLWRRTGSALRRPAAPAERPARQPARCSGPGSASGARLPPPGTGGPAAEIYRGAGRRFPGPPGARAPITGSHGGPGPRPPSPRRRALARPRSPACPFFSIHADAQRRRRRRQRGRRRRRRPPGLAGGRGAGTFPRPAARAAHRRRCRRGPGVRPGQSGRAGRGGAAAVGGLVSQPGLPRLPAACPQPPAPPLSPLQRRPSGAPAEQTHRRRAGAGVEGGGGVRPRPEPRSGSSPERPPINGARSRVGGGEAVAREPPPRPSAPSPASSTPPALPRDLSRGAAWERDG